MFLLECATVPCKLLIPYTHVTKQHMDMQLFGQSAIRLLDGGMDYSRAPQNTFASHFHKNGGSDLAEVILPCTEILTAVSENPASNRSASDQVAEVVMCLCIRWMHYLLSRKDQDGERRMSCSCATSQEVEELCNDSARLCNRLRSVLKGAELEGFNGDVAGMAAYLDTNTLSGSARIDVSPSLTAPGIDTLIIEATCRRGNCTRHIFKQIVSVKSPVACALVSLCGTLSKRQQLQSLQAA